MEKQTSTKTCFMIPVAGSSPDRLSRPDGFGNLHDELFLKTVKEAGLTPHQLHPNPRTLPTSARIVDDIVDGIRTADIAFADVSDAGGYTWFALGCAMALNKPLCLVTSLPNPKATLLPSVDTLITYPLHPLTDDYQSLRQRILNRLLQVTSSSTPCNSSHPVAIIDTEVYAAQYPENEQVNSSSAQISSDTIVQLDPHDAHHANQNQIILKSYEILALRTIAEVSLLEGITPKSLAQEMNRFGLVQTTSFAIISLRRKQLIVRNSVFPGTDGQSPAPDTLKVTPAGLNWLVNHSDNFDAPTPIPEPEHESLGLIDCLATL